MYVLSRSHHLNLNRHRMLAFSLVYESFVTSLSCTFSSKLASKAGETLSSFFTQLNLKRTHRTFVVFQLVKPEKTYGVCV